jgi:hypothetical protein
MAFIEGANNPGNRASVTPEGQLMVASAATSAQTEAALQGLAYNINAPQRS